MMVMRLLSAAANRVAIVLILGIVLSACGPSNEYAPPPPADVTVEVVEPRNATSYITVPGRTQATDTVELRARVTGFLDSVNFEPGRMVEQGQLLYQIDPRPFKAMVAAAEGQLASAQAGLQLAIATLQKNETLFQRKVISEIDILQFRAEQDNAVAAVKIAEANLKSAQLDLSFTSIKANIKGRMSRSLVDPGNLVGADGMTLLSTIVASDPIFAYFQFDERALVDYLTDHTPEERVEEEIVVFLELSNGTLYQHAGVVDFIDNQVNPQTGTIESRATFPNPDSDLLPGLFIRALFPQELENAIVIPTLAILRDLGGSYVLTVGDDDVVSQTYIETEARIGTNLIEVTSGLKAGDRIIVLGQQRARPGAKVNVTVRDQTPLPATPSEAAAPEDAPDPGTPESSALAESTPTPQASPTQSPTASPETSPSPESGGN